MIQALLERTKPVARGARVRPARPVRPVPQGVAMVSSALTVVTLLLGCLLAEATVIGDVRHARAQKLTYEQLRTDLAKGEAPIGQMDANGEVTVPGRPVAVLTIPAINLREVVFEGTTAGVLADGPGHRRDTAFPGQAGAALIFGRQAMYGGVFSRIHDLRRGDEIKVATGQGSHAYKVSDVRHAGERVLPVAAGKARLVLATAAGRPFLPEAVVYVDAVQVSQVVPSPERAFGTAALADGEGLMKGDTGTLLPLLLWAQLLLLVVAAAAWVGTTWGRWQVWIVTVPVLTLPALQVAHYSLQLLPNLT